ncbi:MAG: protein kinase [Cystobacterineae bacterium]|nr:protein kinase [Cystobacterineae bacterium]
MKKPLVLGKYHLLDRISIGGMAEVFIAKTFGVGGFEQILAVKRILPTMAEDEGFVKMFIHEARISVQLNHPNIVRIHDLDGRDDSYYIVMDYVSGRDLRSVLDRFRRRKENIPIPVAAYIASKICEGLDYAHRKKDVQGKDLNIVHRDVSPQNILLSYEGEVKIIDFGIAKTNIRSILTEVGVIKGKFGYMSPEQAYGWPVDRRSDVFAAAVILYEMLTGEKLFVAESDFSTLEKVRHVKIRPPRQVNANIPPLLEEVLLRALAQDVEARYQWASDFHEELEKFTFVDGNKFSARDLSSLLKNKFAEEYVNETKRLKNYGGFVAPESLSSEEVPPSPEAAGGFRKGDEPARTPSGQKKFLPTVLTSETEATQVGFLPEFSDGYPELQAFPVPGEELYPSGFSPVGDSAFLEVPSPSETQAAPTHSGPIRLTDDAVYTGNTFVGSSANENSVSERTNLVVRNEGVSRKNSGLKGEGKTPVFESLSRLLSQTGLWLWPWLSRTWVWSSSSAAGVVVLGLVLWALLGASPQNGRLAVLQNPEDIPVEVFLKNNADGREQRVVVKNEMLVLPPGAYQIGLSSADKNYRTQTENLGPIEILKGEDLFVSVQLDAIDDRERVLKDLLGPGTTVALNNTGPLRSPADDDKLPGTDTAAGMGGNSNSTNFDTTTSPGGDGVAGGMASSKKSPPAQLAQETFVLLLGDLPPGTQVSIGGKTRGTTPKLKELTLPMQGSYKIALRKAGYEPFNKTIHNAASERSLSLDVVMRPLPASPPVSPASPSLASSKKLGKLAVSTEPNGAEIWINGQKTAFRTPRTFSNPILLPEGKHTLRFKAGGKQSRLIPVEITAENATTPLSLRAIPLE